MLVQSNRGVGDITDTINSISTWGPLDWFLAIAGGYILFSVVRTTKGIHEGVSGKYRSIKGKRRKREELLEELNKL